MFACRNITISFIWDDVSSRSKRGKIPSICMIKTIKTTWTIKTIKHNKWLDITKNLGFNEDCSWCSLANIICWYGKYPETTVSNSIKTKVQRELILLSNSRDKNYCTMVNFNCGPENKNKTNNNRKTLYQFSFPHFHISLVGNWLDNLSITYQTFTWDFDLAPNISAHTKVWDLQPIPCCSPPLGGAQDILAQFLGMPHVMASHDLYRCTQLRLLK